MDQFLAAVEVRKHPELRGLAVIVGGDGNPHRPRQVVSTASYEAREFGVHSGMPLVRAVRKCPDAIFLPVDHPAYDAASAEVMQVLRDTGHPVEVWGWDEAYLSAETDDPVVLAEQIRAEMVGRTGLTCSVGIGDNKHQAKIATGFGKPNGIGRLDTASWAEVMFHRPVTAVWGIGARTAARLGALQIRTVAELAAGDSAALAAEFGPRIGPWLRVLGQGGGGTSIRTEPWVARSKSRETTFEADLSDRAEVQREVRRLAEWVTAEAVADGRVVHRVAVKVRTSSFYTRTKISKLAAPTVSPAEVAAAALLVLGRFDLDRPIRLLGVQVELDPPTDRPADPVAD